MDSATAHGHASQSPSGAQDGHGRATFPNHSSTLSQSLPANGDDKPSARQRRKRTSPEDQAVLEAAYRRDPKPDKAARLELVTRVALSEKEVQIWFQNRRQSSRRKSRPLLPHEIAHYQMARSAHPPQQSLQAPASDAPSSPDHDLEPRQEHDESEHATAERTPIDATRESCGASREEDTTHALGLAPKVSSMHADQDDSLHPADDSRSVSAALAPEDLSQSLPGRQEMQPTPREAASARRLKKKSSFVRLSMSFDGNASVLTNDESSPSPPRASQVSLLPTHGSRGAQSVEPGADQAPSFAARRSLQRSSSGRSRDSRAWEFWCDKNARTELEEKAEKDSSGSATSAIGLLRSVSGRSILGSVPAKRNSLLPRQPFHFKRSKLDDQRPSLQRSNTSFGRLQGKSFDNVLSLSKPKLKYSESAVSVYVPGNDSDKENWSPDGHGPQNNRSLMQTSVTRHAASGENDSTRNRNEPHGHGSPVTRADGSHAHGGKNAEPEEDAELRAFMRSGQKSASTSSDDDLDCVQGLLSLSQGNWR